jgi:hypothetical protein
MNPLENNLRRMLQQPQPPPDLATKVLARAHAVTRRRRATTHFLRAVATIAVVAFLSIVGWRYNHAREERKADGRAKQQLIEALSLASQHLKPFQDQLGEMKAMTITIPEGEK